MDHYFFMKMALEEAKKAYLEDEVPIGAVVVHENKVIATGYNRVESAKDASAHAEMIALKKASEVLGGWRLQDCTLYCTLEPCSMCAGAMFLFRIQHLVWGAPDIRHGANGSLCNLFSISHPIHKIEVTKGILEGESSKLLKEFFQEKRKK